MLARIYVQILLFQQFLQFSHKLGFRLFSVIFGYLSNFSILVCVKDQFTLSQNCGQCLSDSLTEEYEWLTGNGSWAWETLSYTSCVKSAFQVYRSGNMAVIKFVIIYGIRKLENLFAFCFR